MKTVSVISQKGGAGKTTLAVHLATAAQRAGRTAAVVDLDPQATARRWGDKRGVAPEVVSDHAVRLPALLDAARANGADMVFVDTAPNADQAALGAARAADLAWIIHGTGRSKGRHRLPGSDRHRRPPPYGMAGELSGLVLIPCRPSAFDLEAIEATLTLAELARKPAAVILNAAAPRSGLTGEA